MDEGWPIFEVMETEGVPAVNFTAPQPQKATLNLALTPPTSSEKAIGKEPDLAALLHSFQNRPLDFLKVFHPAPLRKWQAELFGYIQEQLLSGNTIVRVAIASGHGVGKSRAACLLIIWGLLTMPETGGFCTSNTLIQLKSKLWGELGIAWKDFPDFHYLFELTATSLQARDSLYARSWRIDAIPHSEDRTQSMAGLHRQTRSLVIFDEASELSEQLFESVAGATTDAACQRIHLVLGNPTQTFGPFFNIFQGKRHGWRYWHVSCIGCEGIDPEFALQIAADYGGEDSPSYKVRVLGQFADLASSAFFTSAMLETGLSAESIDLTERGPYAHFTACVSVDPARYGDLATIMVRRGPKAQVMAAYSGCPLTTLAQHVARIANEVGARHIIVDNGGLGHGVVDLLVDAGFDVEGVHFQQRARGLYNTPCANRRAEMHVGLRAGFEKGQLTIHSTNPEWLEKLREDLRATEQRYPFDVVALIDKQAIKKGLGRSPDFGDAAALLCAVTLPAATILYQNEDKWSCDYNPMTVRAA